MLGHRVTYKSAKTCIQRLPNHIADHSEMRDVLAQLNNTILDALEGIEFTACSNLRISLPLLDEKRQMQLQEACPCPLGRASFCG